MHIAAIAATIATQLGCGRAIAPLVEPTHSAVALTGGPNTSMVYLARTADGVIAIDLGWWRSSHAVAGALRELDAAPGDVADVFLTHSHRDHIGAWRLLRRSRFHVADSERPLLFGEGKQDKLFPVAGYMEFFDKVGRLYKRYGQQEAFRMVEVNGSTFRLKK